MCIFLRHKDSETYPIFDLQKQTYIKMSVNKIPGLCKETGYRLELS